MELVDVETSFLHGDLENEIFVKIVLAGRCGRRHVCEVATVHLWTSPICGNLCIEVAGNS